MSARTANSSRRTHTAQRTTPARREKLSSHLLPNLTKRSRRWTTSPIQTCHFTARLEDLDLVLLVRLGPDDRAPLDDPHLHVPLLPHDEGHAVQGEFAEEAEVGVRRLHFGCDFFA